MKIKKSSDLFYSSQQCSQVGFLKKPYGFIREFWVAEKHRNKKHGSELLKIAEQYLYEQGIYSSILTTDTAEHFYLKHGYEKIPGCKAKNDDDVFVKRLN